MVRGRGMESLVVYSSCCFTGRQAGICTHMSILQGEEDFGWPRSVGGMLASTYESSFGAFGCVAYIASAFTDQLNLLCNTV